MATLAFESKYTEDTGYPSIGGSIGPAPSTTIAPVPTTFDEPVLKYPTDSSGPTIAPPPPTYDNPPPPVTGTVTKPSCGGTCKNPNASPAPAPGSANAPAMPSSANIQLAEGTTPKAWYEGIPWYVWVALALATYSTLRK